MQNLSVRQLKVEKKDTVSQKMLAIFYGVLAHITLNPNQGSESGSYFHTTVRVPHGSDELHTTGLILTVPHGILIAKPEVPDGWTAFIDTRDLDEHEQYVSHGMLKEEAPSRITLTANSHGDGVHDDHLLNVDMQLKVGCVFDDPTSNSVWNQEYTLWWQIEQICEDDVGNRVVLKWNGTQTDDDDGSSPPWSALPHGTLPAPYMYVEPGLRCNIAGTDLRGGLMWFGTRKGPDVPSSGPDMPSSSTPDGHTTLAVAIAGVALGALATSLWVADVCIRLGQKSRLMCGVDVNL